MPSEGLRLQEGAAKARCLDKLIASESFEAINEKLQDEMTEWEQNFVISLKDQVDRLNRVLTLKQLAKIEQIYQNAVDNDMIEKEDYKSYMSGPPS